MSDCIFCKIANGEIPSNTLYEDNNFRIILDISPANPGHTLILPKKHFENVFDVSDSLVKDAFLLAKKTACALMDLGFAEGVNILQNNGEAAGQTVGHFHIHVIPRKKDDGVTIKSEVFEVSEEEMGKIAKTIFKALN